MTNLRHKMTAPTRIGGAGLFPSTRNDAPVSNQKFRSVQFSWLSRLGELQHRTTRIPDIPLFVSAFNAFARGALVQTPAGPVAVEDLVPGMLVSTVNGPATRINWTGTMASVPVGKCGTHSFLYRVTEGSYGLGTGKPDLLLGPGARLMSPRDIASDAGRLQSIADIADGQQVIRVAPRNAVQLYHFALPSHRLIRVNDVAMESFHPGGAGSVAVGDDLFGQYVSLFPQTRTLGEFGPLNYMR